MINKNKDGRYGVLELTKSFVEDNQQDQPGQEAARLRLAEYFVTFESTNLHKRMAFFKDKKEDIDAAMKWCHHHKRWELVLKLADLFSICYGLLGRYQMRFEWGKRAMISCQELGDSHRYSWYRVYDVGYVRLLRGGNGLERAKQLYDEEIKISDQKGYKDVATIAYRNRGVIAYEEGDYEKALSFLEKSLESAQGFNKPFWIAMTQKALARALYKMDELQEAKLLLEEARTTVEENGEDFEEIVKIQSDLGLVLCKQGIADQGESLLKKAKDGAESRGLERALAYNMTCRAEIELLKRNLELAEELAKKAIEIFDKSGAIFWAREPKRIYAKAKQAKVIAMV